MTTPNDIKTSSNTASLTAATELQVAASRTLTIAAEREDVVLGVSIAAEESIAVESRRNDVNLRGNDISFLTRASSNTLNFEADEIEVLMQLDIGGTPQSATFDSTEGDLTNTAVGSTWLLFVCVCVCVCVECLFS